MIDIAETLSQHPRVVIDPAVQSMSLKLHPCTDGTMQSICSGFVDCIPNVKDKRTEER
jgi:hypothetical protein